jgi:hypothetical protein
MTENKNWFTVTISRINEGLNQAPYITMEGHTLSLSPDGTLSISGDNSRGLNTAAGLYDGFEVKRLKVPTRGD